MAAELVAPTVFYAWYRALTRALYADETGELFEDVWWFRPVFVKSALDGGDAAAWCDDRETEAWRRTAATWPARPSTKPPGSSSGGSGPSPRTGAGARSMRSSCATACSA